ncbi:hypothetical protein SI65_03678 [Aspergillus cristatus]|uniref:Uncharacterized protein n=1 Tax=Aspergillus cristatus TaxID=573508 RepID=A0A1E3BI38_ASPCR|nr:hypothetical protein SI65_03678 [Aspergillus cristatus]
MPDHMFTLFLIYPTPPDFNLENTIISLKQSLANARNQIPLIASQLQFNNNTPSLIPSKSIDLQVRNLSDEHKPYSDLAAHSFAPTYLDREVLLSAEDPSPVCRLQLNIIQGGLIFAFGANHIVFDLSSAHTVLSLLCRGSNIYNSNCSGEMPTYKADIRRDAFKASPQATSLSKKDLIQRLPTHRIINSPPVVPTSTIRGFLYEISEPAIQTLKDKCKPLGVQYLSTYDCIVAWLWTSITRVRLAERQKTDSQSSFFHPVNLRNRFPVSVPNNYIGNAVGVARAGPLDISCLLGENGPSIAASQIRQSIQKVNMDIFSNLAALYQVLAPTEQLVLDMDTHTGMDLMLTSWYEIDKADYDFGWGTPQAVWIYNIAVAGRNVIFPNCDSSSWQYDLWQNKIGCSRIKSF